MAWDKPLFTIPGARAAADYRTTSKQYYCMKKNTTDEQYALCDTDGEVFDGVLYNKPNAAAKEADIVSLGVVKVVAGEALTAGDFWKTDSAGKAAVAEGTVTGADVGDYVAGRVIVGAASGAIAIVTIGMSTFRVEAQ